MYVFGSLLYLLFVYATNYNEFNITKETFDELQQSFWYFDRDMNGVVNVSELAIGIISAGETPISVWKRHYFGEKQCSDPILDSLSFSECLVARARARGKGSGDEEVNFREALRQYLVGCTSTTVDWLMGRCLGSCHECAQNFVQDDKNGCDNIDSTPLNGNLTSILISSDWHVEPWYSTGSTKNCVGKVCRYKDANLTNMFTCKNIDEEIADCTLNGWYDAPITLEESHIMSSRAAPATVHFYLGDTQAHEWGVDDMGPSPQDAPGAISKMLNRILSEEVWRFNSPDNIVWTPGNNDGKHNEIFRAQDSWTIAYASQLLWHNIVTDNLGIMYGPKNQTTIFRESGFYAKRLPTIAPTAYAIVINTNLGGDNQLTMSAVNTTLSWIWERHGNSSIVYFFGHHPSVMNGGINNAYIPMKYRSIIKGAFAGHVHKGYATTGDLLTVLPAVTQASWDNAFYVVTVSEDSPEIVVQTEQMIYYCGDYGKQADSTMWK